ncbi:MAG: family 16 glycosylhydrolase [Candidatus Symbiothrix sp.]|jgi:beta-glucanase (GH16 family)|nr:family 16 glycosylhydrolase [Candidatus Symbiothrix sp.]
MKRKFVFMALLAMTVLSLSAQRQSPYTQLVWSDEFNGTGLPDPAKWDYEVGYVRNGELQYFTRERVENAYQEGGYLHIRAINNDPVYDAENKVLNNKDNAQQTTSASIITKGKVSWLYGRIEVRAKVPGPNKGSWPAIWMMPVANRWGNWPNSGEIDIMEHVGYAPEQTHFTAHTYKYNNSFGVMPARGTAYDTPGVYNDFHVFALEWDTEGLYWYFDDRKIPAFEFYNESSGLENDWQAWPFLREFYLMLGLAYGGGWGGRNGVDWQLPMEYLVDYVRVYKMPESAITTVSDEPINIYPNPVENILHFDGIDRLREISIKNISGQTVARFQNVEKSVDLSHLDKGYYILQLKDADGNPYSRKILKR